MISLSKEKSRLYNLVIEVINQVMDNYGYDYLLGISDNKYYTNNLENISVYNKVDNTLEKVELITLGYYLFKRLGLEDIEISINKDEEICNLLDILDIDYLSNIKSSKLTWKYIIDDTIIGEGTDNNFKIDTNILLNKLFDLINKSTLKRIVDVNIIAVLKEEKYYALKVAQSLRINNINTDINKDSSSKFNIILNEDDLNKGLVTIKDNLTMEKIKIDEADILDYFLANI